MLENVGSAILIVGAIYLHLVHGLHIVWTIFLCCWGLILWLTIDPTYLEKIRKYETKKRMLEIELLETKIEYYKRRIKND